MGQTVVQTTLQLVLIQVYLTGCFPSWFPSYLDQSVLRSEPGPVCGWTRVQGADVLSRPWPIAVEVEAVACLRPHQVAQTWNRLRRVNLGLRLCFNRDNGLLQEIWLLINNSQRFILISQFLFLLLFRIAFITECVLFWNESIHLHHITDSSNRLHEAIYRICIIQHYSVITPILHLHSQEVKERATRDGSWMETQLIIAVR